MNPWVAKEEKLSPDIFLKNKDKIGIPLGRRTLVNLLIIVKEKPIVMQSITYHPLEGMK